MTTFRTSKGAATVGFCLLLICLWCFNARAAETHASQTKTGMPSASQPQSWSDLKAAYHASLEGASPGRFQAVRLDGSSIFILDTRLGHMWAWAFGEQGGFTTYQGWVVPGLKMGDIIEAYQKRRSQKKK